MLGCCFSIATSMRKSCTLLRLLHSPFKRLLPSKAWQGFHAVSLDCEIMWNWNRVEIRVPVASRAKQALSGLWQCHKPPWNHPRALVRGCQMSRISAAGTKIRVISLMSISFLILWMGSLTFRLLWDVEEGTNQRFRRLNIYNLNALMTLEWPLCRRNCKKYTAIRYHAPWWLPTWPVPSASPPAEGRWAPGAGLSAACASLPCSPGCLGCHSDSSTMCSLHGKVHIT